MLDLTSSRLRDASSSFMAKTHSTVASMESGTCLVRKLENGEEALMPCAGVAGEIVAGFAMGQYANVTVAPVVEEITVPPAPHKVTLSKTPKTKPVGYGGAPITSAAGDRNVTFAVADEGKTIRVVYSYEPTVTEAGILYGHHPYSDGYDGMTGVIDNAEVIYISNFDHDSDWWSEDAGPVYTAPNGNVTLDNSGTLITGVTVKVAPSAHNAMLGLAVSR